MDLTLLSTELRLFLPTPACAEADFFSKNTRKDVMDACVLSQAAACPINNKLGGIELDLCGCTASRLSILAVAFALCSLKRIRTFSAGVQVEEFVQSRGYVSLVSLYGTARASYRLMHVFP